MTTNKKLDPCFKKGNLPIIIIIIIIEQNETTTTMELPHAKKLGYTKIETKNIFDTKWKRKKIGIVFKKNKYK